jgi:hypothetical protein
MDGSLRPMSTSQVLDRTFFLYRNNFVLFAGIALITPTLTLMARLVQLAMFGMPVMPNRVGGDPSAVLGKMMPFFAHAALGGMIGLIIYMVGYAITTGATVQAVSMLHLGRLTSIKESYQRVKSIWGRLMLLVIRIFLIASWPLLACYGLLIALMVVMLAARGSAAGLAAAAVAGLGLILVLPGFIAGIIWAVIAYCRYALAVPACVVENLPIKYALIRGKFLSKGNVGRVFAVYFLTAIITIAVKSLLQVPVYISGGFSFRTGLHLTPGLMAWTYASEFISALIAGPIAAIAMALVYYDERVRKEAFDLQVMMESMRPGDATQVGSV